MDWGTLDLVGVQAEIADRLNKIEEIDRSIVALRKTRASLRGEISSLQQRGKRLLMIPSTRAADGSGQ